MNGFTRLCDEYGSYDDDTNHEFNSIGDSESVVEREEDSEVENTPPQHSKNSHSGPSTNSNSPSHAASSPDADIPKRTPLVTVSPDDQMQRNTRPGHLRDLLERDTNCRAVVLKYDSSNSLTNRLRNRLARFIIDYEKKKNYKDLKKRPAVTSVRNLHRKMHFFAEQIHQTFPRESPSTYYSPFRRVNGVTINASGKLWWHYDYAKNKLFKDGILGKRGKKSNVPSNPTVVPASCAQKLELLHTKLAPWTDVIQLWIETYEARRNDLFHNNLSVKDYIETYACLRVKDTLSLFQADFSKLHPNAVDRLRNTWELTTDHLVEKLNSLEIKDAQDIELRLRLKSDDSDLRAGILLSLLPYLVPPRRPGRKRKSAGDIVNEEPETPRILTLPEKKESFFVHIADVVDLETVLVTGKNHVARLSLQHQPIPIIVGPFENISACYIILENILYESSSILHAFESAIHICYAVNCEYPLNARSLWIFLQQAYLNIEESTDKPSVEVTALIGEIKSIIKEVEESDI